jgi:hypothetical protein
VFPFQCLGQSRNRQVPRAPLPASGVTVGGEMSGISSEGVTPPSSLIRTHASDQIPPSNFGFPYLARSLQVAVSPCWKMALPDVISAVCVKELGPLPRRVPGDPVRLGVRALRVDALIEGRRPRPRVYGLGTRNNPCNATSTGGVFRGCSHSLMFMLLHLLGPPVAPTAVRSTGQPGRLHHAMDMWLPALIAQGFT